MGLEIKAVNTTYLVLAYSAVILTSAFGLIIAFHHRQRQKEKFEIIAALEKELGIDVIIGPVLSKAHSTWAGEIDTSKYIFVMQAFLCVISVCLLGRLFVPEPLVSPDGLATRRTSRYAVDEKTNER